MPVGARTVLSFWNQFPMKKGKLAIQIRPLINDDLRMYIAESGTFTRHKTFTIVGW